MNTSDKKAKMADPLAAAHAGGRIVLSAEELFALSVQLARRIENDPATLRALAEAFGRLGEPPYRKPRRSSQRRIEERLTEPAK
jgi:hypothetical protein